MYRSFECHRQRCRTRSTVRAQRGFSQDLGYGENSELLGYDLYPYTEDQVAAVRRAILQWEFIWDLAEKIERPALEEARNGADALAGQKAVYKALGLDESYEGEVARRRKEARRERKA